MSKTRTKPLYPRWPKGCLPPTGYNAWHDWAYDQHHIHGLRQTQCPCCSLWYFPQELAQHNGRDSQ